MGDVQKGGLSRAGSGGGQPGAEQQPGYEASALTKLWRMVTLPSPPSDSAPGVLDLDPDILEGAPDDPDEAAAWAHQVQVHWKQRWTSVLQEQKQAKKRAEGLRSSWALERMEEQMQEEKDAVSTAALRQLRAHLLAASSSCSSSDGQQAGEAPGDRLWGLTCPSVGRRAVALYRQQYRQAQEDVRMGREPRLPVVWKAVGDVLAWRKAMASIKGKGAAARLPICQDRELLALLTRAAWRSGAAPGGDMEAWLG